MECEMCGNKVGTRRHMVDGVVMNLGLCCGRYGTPLDQPAPTGSKAAMQQGLERRATRMASKNIYSEDAEELVEDYGRRILQAREKKGWTREQLGNKVSARVPELTHIEAGKLRPGDDVARRIEKELNIKLFEKVPTAPVPQKKAAGGGVTIGDILKDALKK